LPLIIKAYINQTESMRSYSVSALVCSLIVLSTINASVLAKDEKDVRKRLNDLQSEIDKLKAELDETEREKKSEVNSVDSEEAVSALSKRFSKWRDPKRPMLVDNSYFKKKKSISDEDTQANEKSDDELLRLLVRALQEDEQ